MVTGDDAVARALRHVGSLADETASEGRHRLEASLGAAVSDEVIGRLMTTVRQSRITLNFHPDRTTMHGTPVARGLLDTGQYLPQWLTGVSSGERSAVEGGRRTGWENDLFDHAYAGAVEGRPVYGVLDLTKDPFGGAPRFGSCFVELRTACLDRATLCVGDSHLGPSDVGTMGSLTSVLAGIYERWPTVLDADTEPPTEPSRQLDDYVEAQVHGGISLTDDVVAVVADPSFRSTAVHDDLAAAAEKYDFDLKWHGGSEVHVADITEDFRGPSVLELGQLIADANGMIDAAAIGRSAAAIPYSPLSPGGDVPESPLQQHKYLWHCLLHFGKASSE